MILRWVMVCRGSRGCPELESYIGKGLSRSSCEVRVEEEDCLGFLEFRSESP